MWKINNCLVSFLPRSCASSVSLKILFTRLKIWTGMEAVCIWLGYNKIQVDVMLVTFGSDSFERKFLFKIRFYLGFYLKNLQGSTDSYQIFKYFIILRIHPLLLSVRWYNSLNIDEASSLFDYNQVVAPVESMLHKYWVIIKLIKSTELKIAIRVKLNQALNS